MGETERVPLDVIIEVGTADGRRDVGTQELADEAARAFACGEATAQDPQAGAWMLEVPKLWAEQCERDGEIVRVSPADKTGRHFILWAEWAPTKSRRSR